MLKKIIYTLIVYNKILSTDSKEQIRLGSCVKDRKIGKEKEEMSNHYYFKESNNTKNEDLQKQLSKNDSKSSSNNDEISHLIFELSSGGFVRIPKDQVKNSLILDALNYSSLIKEKSESIVLSLSKDEEDPINNITNSNNSLESLEFLSQNKEKQQNQSSKENNKVQEYKNEIVESSNKVMDNRNKPDHFFLSNLETSIQKKQEQQNQLSKEKSNSRVNSMVSSLSSRERENISDLDAPLSYISPSCEPSCSNSPGRNFSFSSLEDLQGEIQSQKFRNNNQNNLSVLKYNSSDYPASINTQFLASVEASSPNFPGSSNTQVLASVKAFSVDSSASVTDPDPSSNTQVLARVIAPSPNTQFLLNNPDISPNFPASSNAPFSFNFGSKSFVEIPEDLKMQEFKDENNKKNIDLNDREYLKELTGNIELNTPDFPHVLSCSLLASNLQTLQGSDIDNQSTINNQLAFSTSSATLQFPSFYSSISSKLFYNSSNSQFTFSNFSISALISNKQELSDNNLTKFEKLNIDKLNEVNFQELNEFFQELQGYFIAFMNEIKLNGFLKIRENQIYVLKEVNDYIEEEYIKKLNNTENLKRIKSLINNIIKYIYKGIQFIEKGLEEENEFILNLEKLIKEIENNFII